MYVKRKLRIGTDCRECAYTEYCKNKMGVQDNLNSLTNGSLLEFFEGANNFDDLKNTMTETGTGWEIYCRNFKKREIV